MGSISPKIAAQVRFECQDKFVEATIDGKKVRVPEGISLYDVLKENNKFLPAMCYHHTFTPFGSCGVCLVEVEGKANLVRSCTAPVQQNMVVRTDSEKVREGRKKAIEKYLSMHPLDCPVCDSDGHCELQNLTFSLGVDKPTLPVKRRVVPEDTRSLVLDFNMERCILCGQCINICKEVQIVDALAFFKRDGLTVVGAKGDQPLWCEFCGDCLAVCPVGAITNKFAKYLYKPWQFRRTTTTCAYCSDGCQLIVEVENPKPGLEEGQERIVRVKAPLSWDAKWGEGAPVVGYSDRRAEEGRGHGGICVRGRFGFQYVHSPRRLTHPLVRRHKKLVETPWLEAIRTIARTFVEIRMKYGSEAIAGIISARCTNEDIYLFQKFMRMGLGTNNIDSTARYGHINAVLGLKKAVGSGRAMSPYEEITKAQVILLIGSNITDTNPIAGLRVKEAMRIYGAKVIVIHPAVTNMAKLTPHHLPIRLGSEGVLIQGLIKVIIERDLCDETFKKNYPGAYEKLKNLTAKIPSQEICERTGIPEGKLVEVAEIFTKAERGVILFGEEIVGRRGGYYNVLNLVDLAIVSGKTGKEGCGLTPLCEENNEQGVVDMGGVPEFLPGPLDFSDDEVRERFARAWGGQLPPKGGASLSQILEKASRGEIKALYIIGENPLGTLPSSMKVREALEKVECIVCQDPFLTETATLAHVVLPACTFAEKKGTFTNMEGRVNKVNPVLSDPVGESRPDWKIISTISQKTGYFLEYRDVDEISEEISQLVPGYDGGKEKRVEVHLTPYLSNGCGEADSRYGLPPLREEPAYPYFLLVGQVLFHSGKLSARDQGLTQIYPTALLKMNESDGKNLGVSSGDTVTLKSPHGEVEVVVDLIAPVSAWDDDLGIPPGVLFFPEHFNDPAVKDLLSCELDPVTGVPYFKLGRVSVEKITK